jgi:hypothetical protein
VVQDELLLGLWLSDTRQANPATFAEVEPGSDKDGPFQRVNDLGWSETSSGGA